MNKILDQIEADLQKKVDQKYKAGAIRFFKEPIFPLGVRSADLKLITAKYWKIAKNLDKPDFLSLCEELMKKSFEEETIAIKWLFRYKKNFTKADFKLFSNWLQKYIKNWAHCDDFCVHVVGYILLTYPELLENLDKWVKSNNRWLKRGACVSLIYPINKSADTVYLNKIFAYSDILISDSDDLVQKGYGWALKVASEKYQKQVFDFVVNRKNTMPRTAYRYALEKMPKELYKKALQ